MQWVLGRHRGGSLARDKTSFLEKFRFIFSSWNKLAIKPLPPSFPFNFTEFIRNKWAPQPALKQGSRQNFLSCPALGFRFLACRGGIWLEKSVAGGRAISSIHPAAGSEIPTARCRGTMGWPAGVQASCAPGAEGGRSDLHLVSSYAHPLEPCDKSVR